MAAGHRRIFGRQLLPEKSEHASWPRRASTRAGNRDAPIRFCGLAEVDYKKIFSSSPLDYQQLTKTVLQRRSPFRRASVNANVFVTGSLSAAYASTVSPAAFP